MSALEKQVEEPSLTDRPEAPDAAAPLSLRERKKRDKLAAIRVAARELFAEHGVDGATTRAISERAGIGVGTLFSYFPDKQSLLTHLFVTEIGEVADAAVVAAKGSAAPLVDRLLGIFRAAFAWYARDERLARAVIREFLFLSPDNKRAFEASSLGFVTKLAALVDDARERGEIPAASPGMLVATACFAQYFFALTSWLGGTVAPSARDAVLRQLLERTVHGPPRTEQESTP